MCPVGLPFLLLPVVLLLVRSQIPQRQQAFNIAQVHTLLTTLLQILHLLLLMLLQPLLMKTGYESRYRVPQVLQNNGNSAFLDSQLIFRLGFTDMSNLPY